MSVDLSRLDRIYIDGMETIEKIHTWVDTGLLKYGELPFSYFNELPLQQGVVLFNFNSFLTPVHFIVKSPAQLNVAVYSVKHPSFCDTGIFTLQPILHAGLVRVPEVIANFKSILRREPKYDYGLTAFRGQVTVNAFAHFVLLVSSYILFYRDEPKALEKSALSVQVPLRHKKQAKNGNKEITIGVYRISSELVARAPRPIVRHTDAWGVRGFFRYNPKTGQRDIFVKSHVRGPKRNEVAPEPHAYRVKHDN